MSSAAWAGRVTRLRAEVRARVRAVADSDRVLSLLLMMVLQRTGIKAMPVVMARSYQ